VQVLKFSYCTQAASRVNLCLFLLFLSILLCVCLCCLVVTHATSCGVSKSEVVCCVINNDSIHEFTVRKYTDTHIWSLTQSNAHFVLLKLYVHFFARMGKACLRIIAVQNINYFESPTSISASDFPSVILQVQNEMWWVNHKQHLKFTIIRISDLCYTPYMQTLFTVCTLACLFCTSGSLSLSLMWVDRIGCNKKNRKLWRKLGVNFGINFVLSSFVEVETLYRSL